MVSPSTVKSLSETVPFPFVWTGLSEYSEPFFVGLLAVLWVVYGIQRNQAFWTVPAHITLSLALAVPTSVLLRILVGRTRPFADGSFQPLSPHEADFGFPSNHAVATAVFTVVFLWFGYRRIGGFVAILTLLVGTARVITGIHYPGDILAGWLVGTVVSVFVCHYHFARYSWLPDRLKPD